MSKEIQKAVHEVFLQYGKEGNIPLPAVAGLVCQKLQVSRDDYKEMVDRVYKYLRLSNKRGGKYEIRSGRHGGVSLRKGRPGPISHVVQASFVLEMDHKSTPEDALKLVHRFLSGIKSIAPIIKDIR